MRAFIFFIFFLAISFSVSAQELNDYRDLKVNVKVQGNADMIKQSGSYQLEYVSSELSFFPRNDEFQAILNDKTFSYPASRISKGDNLEYRWNEFNPGLSFGINSEVSTQMKLNKVNKKIKFPIEQDLSEFQIYLQPTDLVNSDNPRIIAQAKKLAEGEDDLYEVVYKIALWTKENINYSLETLTAEATQNSVWVYENRRGVCDELTTLFVAMLRSLGIPAKFVLGSSYTNVIGGFGNHAWAEVYFPEFGWVAFDPTYGQLGNVDSTHIKMKESVDTNDPSINYQWRSRNLDVKPGEVSIEVSVAEKGDLPKYNLDMELELLKNNVGAGSYVPLKVAVQNNENYYLPVTLYLTKGPSKVEDNSADLLLGPNERAIAFFHIEIPRDLNKNLVYESELEVQGPGELMKSIKLEYGEHYSVYTKEEAISRIERVEKEADDEKDLDLSCSPDKEVYYVYEGEGVITCEIVNKENVGFKDLQLCFGEDCRRIDLLWGKNKKIEFQFDLEEKNRESYVSLEGDEILRSSYFNLNIISDADIKITNLEYPKTVNYKGNGEVKFTLSPNSKVDSVEVKVGNKLVFSKEELRFRNDFIIPFDGDFFFFKDPYIEVKYKDLNNKEHAAREAINIEVINIPWYAKIMRIFSF